MHGISTICVIFRFWPILVGIVFFLLTGFSISLAVSPLDPINNRFNTHQKTGGPTKGEVLVKFKKGFDPSRLRARGLGRGIVAKKRFAIMSRRQNRVYQHVASGDLTTAKLLEIFRFDPQVAAVSPNYARSLHRRPNDAYFDKLWGMQNTGQFVNGVTGTPGADIDAIPAWNITTGAPEVVVAVIDSGLFFDHEDLFPNMWHNPDEVPGNDIDDDGNGYIDDIYGYDFAADDFGNNDSNPIDFESHGTHVAGTVAAVGNNGLGISGIAWNAKMMAIKAMRPNGYLYDSDLIEAIEYVISMKERGVNVVAINASYGSQVGDQSDPMRDIIAEAGQAGIVFVTSAGNEKTDNDQIPTFPAAYDAANIIAVAASDQADNLALFSNYGVNSVDLTAPGKNIYSTGIEVDASVTCEDVKYPAANIKYAGFTFGTTGRLYDCGKGYPTQFPQDTSKYIALIERGSDDANYFHIWQKVQNAADNGAAAVIIYNDRPGLLYNASLLSAGNWLPAVFLSQADGQYLASDETCTVTVANAVSAYRYSDGTSMATSHVAGAVAILAAEYPAESVSQRINRILAGVDYLAPLAGLVSTGGRLNLNRSLRLYGKPGVNIAPINNLLLLDPN